MEGSLELRLLRAWINASCDGGRLPIMWLERGVKTLD